MKKGIRQRIELFSDRSIGSKVILTAQVSFLLLIISPTPVSAYAKNFYKAEKWTGAKNSIYSYPALTKKQITVQGTVTDKSGTPLIGVSIKIKGTFKISDRL